MSTSASRPELSRSQYESGLSTPPGKRHPMPTTAIGSCLSPVCGAVSLCTAPVFGALVFGVSVFGASVFGAEFSGDDSVLSYMIPPEIQAFVDRGGRETLNECPANQRRAQ